MEKFFEFFGNDKLSTCYEVFFRYVMVNSVLSKAPRLVLCFAIPQMLSTTVLNATAGEYNGSS